VTGANSSKTLATTYIEDPAPDGEPLLEEQERALGRSILARHYSRIFTKLDLTLFASALTLGFALTRQLTFQIPVWVCATPPFLGEQYIGGYYQTGAGLIPTLTERGWQFPFQLGAGHAYPKGPGRVNLRGCRMARWQRRSPIFFQLVLSLCDQQRSKHAPPMIRRVGHS
jgi:hypothetical protein